MKCKVALNSVNDVKAFVNITFRAEKDVDIHCGKYHIDGKSIMGIFSLDLSSALELVVHSDDCAAFLAEIKSYIVE